MNIVFIIMTYLRTYKAFWILFLFVNVYLYEISYNNLLSAFIYSFSWAGKMLYSIKHWMLFFLNRLSFNTRGSCLEKMNMIICLHSLYWIDDIKKHQMVTCIFSLILICMNYYFLSRTDLIYDHCQGWKTKNKCYKACFCGLKISARHVLGISLFWDRIYDSYNDYFSKIDINMVWLFWNFHWIKQWCIFKKCSRAHTPCSGVTCVTEQWTPHISNANLTETEF